MTTTLEKEEIRLEELIKFINKTQQEQKKLIEDYKKLTGLNIELSYLRDSDKLSEYKQRLELVKRVLNIKNDLIKLLNNNKDINTMKIKTLKNKLMKKEILNLLYEFCLIDSLDIKEINIDKLVKVEETKKEEKKVPELIIPIAEEKETPKEEIIIEKEEPVTLEEEVIEQQEPQEIVVEQPVEENKVLSSMPKIDKLGTVSPVNVFESIKKTEEKLPNVVIPTDGLTDENTEIFIDTKEYFN